MSFCFNLDSLGANSLGTNKDIYDNDYSYVKVTRGCDGFTYSVQLAKKDTNKTGVVETSSKNLYEDNYASLIKTGNENFKLCDNSSPKTEVNVGEINKNILSAYVYNESSCITGDEQSCVETTCYKNKSSGSCAPGTAIQYKVNASTTRTFYVLHDDGATLTLLDSEYIDNNFLEWYSIYDSTKGPLTAIETLESATASWTNVNTQTYTMGTTTFIGTNAYTGCDCDYDSCSCTKNTYTWPERSAKARMITLQEAMAVGCTGKGNSCPRWMATVGDYYWTMSADLGFRGAFLVEGVITGSLTQNQIYYIATTGDAGVRAVVVISKNRSECW